MCHTYCDTGHPFVIVILLTPVAERLAVELLLPVLYDLGLSPLEIEHLTFRVRDKHYYWLHQCRGMDFVDKNKVL